MPSTICHAHNLNRSLTAPKPYGIRVSLVPGDSFARLLGPDWSREHWYTTRTARDNAMREMASEHLYSRRGDRPTHRYTPIEKSGEIPGETAGT